MTTPIVVAGLAAGVLHAPAPVDLPAMRDTTIAEINAVRASQGLTGLVRDPDLDTIASIRALDIGVGAFTHTDGGGRLVFWDMMRDAGFLDYAMTGEVLARSNATPSEAPRHAVQLWLDSPKHRAVLLYPGMRYVGLGVYRRDGLFYFALVVISERP